MSESANGKKLTFGILTAVGGAAAVSLYISIMEIPSLKSDVSSIKSEISRRQGYIDQLNVLRGQVESIDGRLKQMEARK